MSANNQSEKNCEGPGAEWKDDRPLSAPAIPSLPPTDRTALKGYKDGRVASVPVVEDIVVQDNADVSVRARLTKPERELLLAIGQGMVMFANKLLSLSPEGQRMVEGDITDAMQKVREEPK